MRLQQAQSLQRLSEAALLQLGRGLGRLQPLLRGATLLLLQVLLLRGGILSLLADLLPLGATLPLLAGLLLRGAALPLLRGLLLVGAVLMQLRRGQRGVGQGQCRRMPRWPWEAIKLSLACLCQLPEMLWWEVGAGDQPRKGRCLQLASPPAPLGPAVRLQRYARLQQAAAALLLVAVALPA